MRAEYAYDKGITGAGQLIGIVDFNFDFSSSETNFNAASLGPNQAIIDIYEAQIGEPATPDPHGQAVAVVAAGVKNDFQVHGVAFDAEILGVDFFSGVNETQSVQGGVLVRESDPFTYLTDRGVRVINISFGFDEGDIIQNPPVVSTFFTLASPINAIAGGALLVAAAGNNGGPEPQLSNLNILDDANAAGLLQTGTGAFIMVGAVGKDLQITSFSDQAGRAMNNFLVAPGEELVFPWTGGALFVGGGTSFAAPHVTGAAALLFQRWPQLSAREVANILLDTATDLGAPGIDAVYGHGLLNIEEAIKPQGTVAVAVAGATAPLPLVNTAIAMGAPFGAARPTGIDAVLALDSYGRDFTFDLSATVFSQAEAPLGLLAMIGNQRRRSSAALQISGHPVRFELRDDILRDGSLAAASQLVRDTTRQRRFAAASIGGKWLGGWRWQLASGMGLDSLSGAAAEDRARPLSVTESRRDVLMGGRGSAGTTSRFIGDNLRLTIGASVDQTKGLVGHPDPALQRDKARYTALAQIDGFVRRARYTLRIGNLFEQQAVLGSRSGGGLKLADRASTSFVGLGGSYAITPGLSIEARANAGLTRVQTDGASLISGFNSFVSTSWSASLVGHDIGLPDSRFSLEVSQPLRVENARIRFDRATGVDIGSGAPIFESGSAALSPTGREVSLEAAWAISRAAWSFQASLLRRFDAGHIAGRNDTAGLFILSRGF